MTQEEYGKVVGPNPSKSKHPRQPVESISWKDAMVFCAKLTDLDRAALKSGQHYTLPTENQWEYLKADAKWEDAVIGHDDPTKDDYHPVEVGSKRSNKFGLHDILGNVWALCRATDGSFVIRGGGFDSPGIKDRYPVESENTANRFTGFRVLVVSSPAP